MNAVQARCSVMILVFQTSCGQAVCNQNRDFISRKLLGLSYGDISAEYKTPLDWVPVQLVRTTLLNYF